MGLGEVAILLRLPVASCELSGFSTRNPEPASRNRVAESVYYLILI
jgi:hypothetical protein